MHLTTRNVNTAFKLLVSLFADTEDGPKRGDIVKRKSSRNGPVLVIDEPMTITYTHPKERVLFNAARDANPAFHLFESLWMLAGRNDLAPLAYYVKDFGRFSDDGKTLNGAYGYRWRKSRANWAGSGVDDGIVWDDVDQLDLLVAHLKAQPESRRAVLQMWNVEDDLLKIGRKVHSGGIDAMEGTWEASKDVCCNLSVMFSLRDKWVDDSNSLGAMAEVMDGPPKLLDMTVTNRSNDMILGMLGANAVHFSFLQEYMAARLGVEVGVYNQFSNNLHVYESNWKPEEWLNSAKGSPEYGEGLVGSAGFLLIHNAQVFERELPKFVEANSGTVNDEGTAWLDWREPFLNDVAQPLLNAFHCHKAKKTLSALNWAERIKAADWKLAAQGWLNRRYNKQK